MKIILPIILAIGISACATHAPMSEMVMFTPKTVYGNHAGEKGKIYYSKYSFAVSGQLGLIDYESLRRYSDEQGYGRRVDDTGKLPTVSLNSIILGDSVDYFAFSISALPVLGADITGRIAQDYYITVGVTAWGGQQVLLQKRLLYNRSVGASMGLYFDRLYQGVYYETGGIVSDIVPEDSFYIHTFGVRGLLMTHNGDKNRFFVNSNFKLGYLFETEDPYLSLGLSVGMF